MKLFEYQERVIECCKNDVNRSQLISMPTGTGKTITFLHLAKAFGKKTLILVHREELLIQTYEKAKLCGFEENEISVVNAEKKEKLSTLNIAMVQSLRRNLEKYSPEDIEMIIVDEAHHATAPSYIKIFDFFKIYEDKYLFGFTATPLRGDKAHLGAIFHSHSFKMTLSEATQLGYIVPVHGIRVEMTKSLEGIQTCQGDYDISELDKVMNCESINNLVVERCKNLRKLPGVIFCTSVNHAETIAKKLRENKIKSISVSYKTSKKSLALIFRMLKQGRISFITNAVKLSEGFDHPPIQSVILARPTRSPVLYKQMIGRGLRNSEGKHDCFVLEFTGNDPNMMKWEDIDETCTFQSSSLERKKTFDEAKRHYTSLFSNPNVIVLDVRISPFEFYECKLRRIIKYKNFFYTPFTEGFLLIEIQNDKDCNLGNYFWAFGTVFFWKEEYKSCYVWGEAHVNMMDKTLSQPINNIIYMIKKYGKHNNFGKWYPSDLEKQTNRQKKLMHSLGIRIEKSQSARKCEMEIEDRAIKSILNKFISNGIFSGILSL